MNAYAERLQKLMDMAVETGLRLDNINDNIGLYEKLYNAGLTYITKIMLAGSESNDMLQDRNETANIIAAHIFWKKLDYLMDGRASLKVVRAMVSNKMLDIVRSNMSAVNVRASSDGDESDNSVITMDELAWSYLSDKADIETDYSEKEMMNEVFRTIYCIKNRFNVVSFLGINLLGYTPKKLAAMMLENGFDSASDRILSEASIFMENEDYFSGASFEGYDKPLKHTEITSLAIDISKASDSCRNQIKNRI